MTSTQVAGTVGAGQGTTITVQGNVLAQSNGTNSTQSNSSSNVAANGDNTFPDSRSEALSGGAARATVASTGAVFGNVGAYGDRGASIDNAGRVRDFAQARSVRDVTLSTSNTGSRVTSTDTAGVTTVVTRSTDASVSQTNGGAADITNRTGGVIEDGAFVSGVAGATFTNAGAIFGNVDVSSSGRRTENSGSFNQTQTTTPATGGGATQRSEFSTSRTNIDAPVGGFLRLVQGGDFEAIDDRPCDLVFMLLAPVSSVSWRNTVRKCLFQHRAERLSTLHRNGNTRGGIYGQFHKPQQQHKRRGKQHCHGDGRIAQQQLRDGRPLGLHARGNDGRCHRWWHR